MNDHTPGPWKVVPSPHGRDYRCVQIGADETYTTLEMKPDDARLIAAAPDMEAVLDELEGAFDEQLYAERSREENDAQDDREYSVNITAKQLRAISRVLSKAEGLS